MRAWRALRAAGAAVLRDGAYLLPDTDACREVLASVERDILAINGTAFILPVVDPDGERFVQLFDRSDDYSKLHTEIEECRGQLNPENALAITKQVRKLRKTYEQLTNIDYFPGKPKQQIDAALQELELAVSRALSSDEPHSGNQPIVDHRRQSGVRCAIEEFQGQRRALGRKVSSQGIVEWQPLAQQQDQLFPETLPSKLLDGSGKPDVHADLTEHEAQRSGERVGASPNVASIDKSPDV